MLSARRLKSLLHGHLEGVVGSDPAASQGEEEDKEQHGAAAFGGADGGVDGGGDQGQAEKNFGIGRRTGQRQGVVRIIAAKIGRPDGYQDVLGEYLEGSPEALGRGGLGERVVHGRGSHVPNQMIFEADVAQQEVAGDAEDDPEIEGGKAAEEEGEGLSRG